MGLSALGRARSLTVGVLSASTAATGFLGVHLAQDHAASVAAGTSTTSTAPSTTQGQQQAGQSSTKADRHSDEHSDDNSEHLFGGDDEGDDGQAGQNSQAPQNNNQGALGSQTNQQAPSQSGFSAPGQLAPGSGMPQVTTRGS